MHRCRNRIFQSLTLINLSKSCSIDLDRPTHASYIIRIVFCSGVPAAKDDDNKSNDKNEAKKSRAAGPLEIVRTENNRT